MTTIGALRVGFRFQINRCGSKRRQYKVVENAPKFRISDPCKIQATSRSDVTDFF